MDRKRAWIRWKKKKAKGKRGLRNTALMLCFCLLVTANPNIPYTVPEIASVFAAEGDLKTHTNHTGWSRMSAQVGSASGNYYLDADNSLYTVTIKSGQTVNLCLNGHVLQGRAECVIKVESGATLNLYDCQGGGRVEGKNYKATVISASGTVNLYGGTIFVEPNSSFRSAVGVYLESGAQLLVDGAEIGVKVDNTTTSVSAAIDIEEGASAEIRSGRIFAEVTDQVLHNTMIIYVKGRCIISGGTIEQTGTGDARFISSTQYGTEDSYIEINGGTIHANVSMVNGNMVINNTKIDGYVAIQAGVLKLQDGQSIKSANEKTADINISRKDAKYGIIELTSPLAHQEGYTIQLSSGTYASSQYPVTVTKNFSKYMPGKQPEDCFTYSSSGAKADHYKMILSGGEVVLLPYVMTFDANGGTLEDSTDYKHVITGGKGDITGGQYMRQLPVPVREGYDFVGWYTQKEGGEEITIDNEPIEEDITVYARWTPTIYPITYELGGGALSAGKTNPETYTIESAAFTLNNPVRTGYTFTGWSGTGLTGNTNKNVTVAKGSLGERTYTANWKAADYTVTLTGNGGSAGTTLTGYTYGTEANLPTNWTKTGYTFAGWYDNKNLTGSKVTAISATDTGNKTFYAKWTANPYTVTFDYQGAAGGNSEKTRTVTYDSTYGTVSGVSKTLPAPTKTGYTFKGWYTQTGGKGSKITDTTTVKITAAQTLYAYWLDETPPDAPVLTSGIALPKDWTNAQKTIPLTLRDGVGVTQLWVSVDGGSYDKVTGFTSGTSYNYPVQEGRHTYRFKAKDAAGNTSDESALFTVKLDTVKPVIGTLAFENRAENLHEWMKSWVIGRKNLTITVPVTESGSGATSVKCIMTPFGSDGSPDASKAETKTFSITNGSAKIAFSKEFKGTLVLSCTDKAGNTSDSVTAGTDGVLVEDTAPVITSDAEEGYYETVPDLQVTIKDEGNIAAGIASVKYKIDAGEEKSVTVRESEIQNSLSFTIPAAELSTGVQQISVHAADNAGNLAEKTIIVKVKGPEHKPEAGIRYTDEKLINLMPEAQYAINGNPVQADGEGCILINEDWIGTTILIVKSGNGAETFDSEAQELNIPARPEIPAPIGIDESKAGAKDGKLTGLLAGAVYQISTDNGLTWTEAEADGTGMITKLAPGSYLVRIKATETSFRSNPSNPVGIVAYPVKITFLVGEDILKTVELDYGGSLTEIPAVPEKEGYTGTWDKEASQFANIQEDMTVQAVYTIKTYRITLPENQTGYVLQLADGASEIVSHGGACKVNYTLAKGYSETEGFAIKVNGKTVLLENGSIVLENITEDMVLTVEGVADITPPEAEIVLGENKWKTLLNKITFGLFFNKTQSVTITAKDRDEDLEDIYYYLADEVLENPADITNWQTYMDTFSIEPGKYVVYAKAVDSAGNIVVLNSEGLVVDTTVPVIKIGNSPAEDNAAYNGEQSLTVDEEWLKSVTLNGTDITKMMKEEGSYTLSPAENPQTITAVDEAGNTSSRTVTISDVPDLPDTPDTPDVPDNPAAPDNAENPEPPAPENPERTPENRGGLPENKKTPEDTEIAAAEPEQEKVPDNGTITDRNRDRRTVPIVMEGDQLILSGETVTTGNIGNTANTKTVLELGSGAVIVTVVCEEKEYAAGVVDTVAVANAVLSPEQKKQAKDGGTVEVEIKVKDISKDVPDGDKNVIEKGIKELKKDIKDLILGTYVDISMAVRVGGGSWETIAATKEPIEIVVGIPEKLQEKGREYYIIRSHEGEYAFLEDIDKEQNTITVSTDRFSTYAIAYQQVEGTADKCGLCHLCPTFLGICYFIWLVILLAAVLLVLTVLLKKRKEKEK